MQFWFYAKLSVILANALLLGQFAQAWDKRQPYETDIRIPLLIRGPGILPKSLSPLPVSLIDVAPTIFDMAKVDPAIERDGRSFYRDIAKESSAEVLVLEERNFLIEYWGEGGGRHIDQKCPWAGSTDLEVNISNI